MNENSTRLLEEAESKLRRVRTLETNVKSARADYSDAMGKFASALAQEFGFFVSDVIDDEGEGYSPVSINRFEVVDMRGESSDPKKQWLIYAVGDDGARIPINGRYKINLIRRP